MHSSRVACAMRCAAFPRCSYTEPSPTGHHASRVQPQADTIKQQRHVLEYLTACYQARMHGQSSPSLPLLAFSEPLALVA